MSTTICSKNFKIEYAMVCVVDYLSEIPSNHQHTGLKYTLQEEFPYSIASLTSPLTNTISTRDISYFLRQIAEFQAGQNDLDHDIKQTAYMVLFTHILRSGLAGHIEIGHDDCAFAQSVKGAQHASGLNRNGDFVGKSGKREEMEKIQAGTILWDELMTHPPFAETGRHLPKEVVLKILKISDPLFWTCWSTRARAITYALDTYSKSTTELQKLSRAFGRDSTDQQKRAAEERDIHVRIGTLHGPDLLMFHHASETWDKRLLRLKEDFKNAQHSRLAPAYREAIVGHLLARATSAFHLDQLRTEFDYRASFKDIIQVTHRIEGRFRGPSATC